MTDTGINEHVFLEYISISVAGEMNVAFLRGFFVQQSFKREIDERLNISWLEEQHKSVDIKPQQ